MVMAASTWGIPGPAFLVGYVALAATAVLATRWVRAAIRRGGTTPDLDGLDPRRLAFLAGGRRLAVYAALAALRRAEAIGARPGRGPRATGPVPADAGALDRAVHAAAGPGTRVARLSGDASVQRALDDLRRGLEGDRLLVSRGRAWGYRAAALILLPVIALGGVRIAAGARAHRPADILILLVTVSSCWLIASLLSRAPWRTRAGDTAVLRLRARHAHLGPDHHPSYATYDAATAAMGVALFGASALFLLDPALAVAAEVRWTGAAGAATAGTAGYLPGLFGTGTGYGSGSGAEAGSGGGCGGGGSGCGG
ncbi:TIGR04222 domain-containing membrane protein [Asanoa sp. NPDC049573]|uniref:TIGR04222 domain-containing membrane protein n=1 Tax=Asanoa sp. NPDC049573 TaxID=3155396 RepID=UPI003446E2E4